MEPPWYMQSIVERNIVMWCMTVFSLKVISPDCSTICTSFKNVHKTVTKGIQMICISISRCIFLSNLTVLTHSSDGSSHFKRQEVGWCKAKWLRWEIDNHHGTVHREALHYHDTMRSCVRLCRTSLAYIFTHIQMYRLTVNLLAPEFYI